MALAEIVDEVWDAPEGNLFGGDGERVEITSSIFAAGLYPVCV